MGCLQTLRDIFQMWVCRLASETRARRERGKGALRRVSRQPPAWVHHESNARQRCTQSSLALVIALSLWSSPLHAEQTFAAGTAASPKNKILRWC
eukprot:1442661-Rhodomonas_salina.1